MRTISIMEEYIMTIKYDKEYRTQYLVEVDFLESKGIKPTFVKTEYGVENYKYTKTSILFKALTEFYK